MAYHPPPFAGAGPSDARAAALAGAGYPHDSALTSFSEVVRLVVQASSWTEAASRAIRAMRELSGLPYAALYVAGQERNRYRAAVVEDADLEALPRHLRIDRGTFADVLAGERVSVLSGDEPVTEALGDSFGHLTLAGLPLRDPLHRPVGLLIAASRDERTLPNAKLEELAELAPIVAGVLSAADASRRQELALSTLPELVDVAQAVDDPVTVQLERLAEIVAQATDSEAAVVRVRDPAGKFIETRAVFSSESDAVSDLIGGRTSIDGSSAESELGLVEYEVVDLPDRLVGWSPSGRRLLELLQARTIAVFPIPSIYNRSGALYLIRKTARPLSHSSRSCARIVSAHMQHIIDRHISGVQTQRAIEAARSAIRLLGEALVAGVRSDQTLRFVPRLYMQMFDAAGCRVWRREADGALSMLAGAGQMRSTEPSPAVDQALEDPLKLMLATEDEPHIAALSVEQYGGHCVCVEFELQRERSLGLEEQELAVDVARRIAEALYSADQSAAHQQELERVRKLQNIIAAAHQKLSVGHALSVVLERVPQEYGAAAGCIFTFDENGRLNTAANQGMPLRLVQAIEQARHWVPEAEGDERQSFVAVSRLATDKRMAPLAAAAALSGVEHHSALMIPLAAREQTIGCLMLLFEGSLPPGVAHEALMLRAFGEHIGSALVNAGEHEREVTARARVDRVLDLERENTRQVRALYEVSRTFATSMSLDETMRAVVEAMADRLDVDAVWIRTPDERGDKLLLRAFYATHPDLAGALERMVRPVVDRTDPVTAQVMKTRQPMLLGEADKAGKPRDWMQRLRPFLQRGSSVAVLPIATPNEVLGTLTMLSIDPDNALTQDAIDIATGVTSQAALALDNARLYQQQKHFADVIQESLLPSRLPQIPELDLGVLYRSATGGGAEVGGDFYDFLQLEDDRLALVVGDVCGKGVAAAADTAMTKYIFRALAREHPSPAAFLSYANEVVYEEITSGKFVTLFYAVIDPKRNTMQCAKAGHPEPKLLHAVEGHQPSITSLELEGLALGIMQHQDYEQREYPFPVGSSLVVYTDGVVEARRSGRLYGQYRLERRLTEDAGASAPRLAFGIYQDCASYAEEGLADDVAIVVAQRVDPDAE